MRKHIQSSLSLLKVRQSRKQIMVSFILPKNEGNALRRPYIAFKIYWLLDNPTHDLCKMTLFLVLSEWNSPSSRKASCMSLISILSKVYTYLLAIMILIFCSVNFRKLHSPTFFHLNFLFLVLSEWSSPSSRKASCMSLISRWSSSSCCRWWIRPTSSRT